MMWRADTAALGLIAVGVALRVSRLDVMEFKADEITALNLGIQLLADRPWATLAWPAHGMPSSQGIPNAPLFNWIVAACWAATRHPVSATALIALVNGITLFPLWRWAKRQLNAEQALLLLGMVAVSPFAVIFSRKLWAQDLLLPGVVCVLWAIEWIRDDKLWRGVVLLGVAALIVGQLHQSGPVALAVLPVAFFIQRVIDRQRGIPPPKAKPPSRYELAAIVLVVVANAFFWIPYLAFLNTLSAETFVRRVTVPRYEPGLFLSVVRQIVPLDLFYFFEPDRGDFLADPARRALYHAAVAIGAPLAVYGVWRWLRAPLQVPVLGVWWLLIIAVFTLARIPSYPFYVLVLAPLPAALVAGAFDGARLRLLARSVLRVLRWTYVACTCALTVSLGSWIAARGGSRGDYGVAYNVREAQARVVIGSEPLATAASPADAPGNTRRLACAPIPPEVEWIIAWLSDQRTDVAERSQLCEGWVRGPDGLRYRWRVISLP